MSCTYVGFSVHLNVFPSTLNCTGVHRARFEMEFRAECYGKGALERRKSAEDDLRTKNIRQTELVLDLRNAILQSVCEEDGESANKKMPPDQSGTFLGVCAHFAECQEPCHRGSSSRPSVNTQADYATGFDLAEEHAQFLCARHNDGQKRRARALINFDQRDDDDLSFRKNQLITIVSEKDEHCWLGELDGRRGWFPAQFVKVIDERGTDYCARGDEMVCARIAELVRGPLAFAFHQILCHGLRSSLKSSLWSSSTSSSSSSHPWTFIEPKVHKTDQFFDLKLLGQLAFNLDVDSELVSADELLASRNEGGGATTAAQMLAAKLCVEETPSSQMTAKSAAADDGTEINGGGSADKPPDQLII
ncbi:hypothetical protein niasHT_015033 [Heterodera trifolii]|uniref:SH3 domain-containing protein n=1 Tax=Heterodera trifolii TaxID=157864 RepID=A0ABD2L0X2_9BILA